MYSNASIKHAKYQPFNLNTFQMYPLCIPKVNFGVLLHLMQNTLDTYIFTDAHVFRFVGNLLVVNLLSTMLLIPLICIDITPNALMSYSKAFEHPLRCIFSEFASAWVTSSSVLATLLIGLDQYLAIVYPLR